MLESTLLSIKEPSSRTLKAFQNVFNNVNPTKPKDSFPTLGGSSAELYDHKDDLMMLVADGQEDRLTALLRHYFAVFFTVSHD